MPTFSPLALGLVAAGGAAGAAARFTLSCMMDDRPNWMATLIANAAGSLLLGLLYGLLDGISGTLSPNLRHLLGVGLLGGFTTFSAFSTQMVDMIERADPLAALTYATGSVMLCLVLAYGGLMAGRSL